MKKRRVLVAAGGTKVRIDDVRFLANGARGRFGLAIARAFVDQGYKVHLLACRDLVDREHLQDDPQRIGLHPFEYFEDFQQLLFEKAAEADIIIMAAAISDWLYPSPASGKMDSSADELTLRFVRAPKLIAALRERCGVKTFIVGFKLESGLPCAELLQKAHKQVRDHRLNLTVANDLKEVKNGLHPVTLVTPEGGEIRVEGWREDVAQKLAEFVGKRYEVRWSKSLPMSPAMGDGHGLAIESACGQLQELLAFAQKAEMFCGTDGNASWRVSSLSDLVITPRKVRKECVGPEDFVYAMHNPNPNPDSEVTHYCGARKPSIDTPVHAALYRAFGLLQGCLHVHPDAGLILTDLKTSFPYPCGTMEEGFEIIDALENGRRDKKWNEESFVVELVNHGYLFGFMRKSGDEPLFLPVDYLDATWMAVRRNYLKHLKEIGHEEDASALRLQPIFDRMWVIGVLATHREEGWVSVYLSERKRGQGIGKRILGELQRRQLKVRVHDLCKVQEFYTKHGWKIERVEGQTALLAPPVSL